ncbi:PDZ domain-containing protein [Haloferula sargassicola]|uniref:PDZ domain-containing protein n=1 Tax=Haloferula sargassicola TaxID=490096 RepID=UPI0033658446
MAPLRAQVEAEVPLQRPEEKEVTDNQSAALFNAVRPVALEASRSTVWVWSGKRMVAMGTVIGDGRRVLTKWSQIGFARGPLQVVAGDQSQARAELVGVYEDDDLAVLELVDAEKPLTPVIWSEEPSPPVGAFLVAASPTDTPLRIGVVAVGERSVRLSDQALFGVYLVKSDSGEVVIEELEKSGGADEAGLRRGDVILSVDDQEINEPFELKKILTDMAPGDSVNVKYRHRGKIEDARVVLGDRSKYKKIPEGRLKAMRAMGGATSVRGDDFPVVIQSDMQLHPQQCGGPVVDLSGKVMGVSISRTDRTRSYIIPASRIVDLLQQDGVSPELAQLPGQGGDPGMAAGTPRPRVVPIPRGAANAMRSHLEEMAEFMRRFDREMEPYGR